MTTAPDHWHCAITQPLADDPDHFATAFMPEALPTQAEARQKLVAPIRAAHDSLGAMSPYGALATIVGIWARQQEPHLLIPGVAIFAVYPCDGDHDAAEQAHMREITRRAATHGNPFTTTDEATRASRAVPPSCNLTPPPGPRTPAAVPRTARHPRYCPRPRDSSRPPTTTHAGDPPDAPPRHHPPQVAHRRQPVTAHRRPP
jgi:hypothetical protein